VREHGNEVYRCIRQLSHTNVPSGARLPYLLTRERVEALPLTVRTVHSSLLQGLSMGGRLLLLLLVLRFLLLIVTANVVGCISTGRSALHQTRVLPCLRQWR